MQLQVETQIYKKNGVGDDIAQAQLTANTALSNSQAKYAISVTEASVTTKIAVLDPAFSNWQLFKGAEIFVKFTNQAYDDIDEEVTLKLTLKSSPTDITTIAHPITDSEGNPLLKKFYWSAGNTVHLMYDGEDNGRNNGGNWRILDIVSVTQYNDLVTTLNEFKTVIGSQTSEISGNIDALTERVSSNETAIEQHDRDIALKANASDVYTTTQTDGLIQDEVIARNAAIEESAGIINQTVEEAQASLTTQILGTYAISTTAAYVVNKIATITPTIINWTLSTGTTITVSFVYENTVANPTLNINSTGEIPIRVIDNNGSISSLSQNEYKWKAQSTFDFTYNGTYWIMQDSRTSVRLNYAETQIEQTANNVLIKATKTGATNEDIEAGATSIIESLINVAPEGVTIDANKVEIDGTAIFNNSDFQALANNAYDAKGTAAGAVAEVAQSKADKSAAIAKTQRIYYRSNSATKPTSYPTTWITTENNIWNNGYNVANGWSRKVTPISSNISDTNKFLYLWTATQKQLVNGNIIPLVAEDIALDDSTTIIDGGKIITNSVTATQISVENLSAIKADMGAITAGSISRGNNSIDFTNDLATLVFKNNSTWDSSTKGIKYDSTGLYIKGDVVATSGTIGGCSINNGVLEVAAANIKSGTIDSARIPNLAINKITNLSTELTTAGNTANSYIYYTASTGLILAGTSPSSATTNYVKLKASGTGVTDAGVTIVGDNANYKTTINSSGMKIYSGSLRASFGTDVYLYDGNSNQRVCINSSNGLILGRWDYVGSRYTQITDGGLYVKRVVSTTDHSQDISMAEFSSSLARIGETSTGHAVINSDGLHVWTGSESDTTNEVASFGATAIIGKTSDYNMQINSSGIDLLQNDVNLATLKVQSQSSNYKGLEILRKEDNTCRASITLSTYALRKTSSVYIESIGNDDFSTNITLFVQNKSQSDAYAAQNSLTIHPTDITVEKPLYFPNNTAIYMDDYSSDARDVLRYDTSNNTILGYGNYALNIANHDTWVEGYNVILRARNKYYLSSTSGTQITSDKRLKKEIKSLDNIENFFMNLEPVSYKLERSADKKRHFGLIAQDVEKSLYMGGFNAEDYSLVDEFSDHEETTKFKTLGYTEFIPLCIKMIQNQQKVIEELKGELNALHSN